MRYKTLLLFGPPGSGKGTIGKIIAQAGEFLHVSSGDIFRGLDPNSAVGTLFHSFASQGKLVPDEVTIQVWHEYMRGLIATSRFSPENQWLILDGIPRTKEQAIIIQQYADIRHVCVLEAEMSVLVDRLKKRALIENRLDDAKESVLLARMKVYEEQTQAALTQLPKEAVFTVNADQKRLEVLRDVLQAIASKM